MSNARVMKFRPKTDESAAVSLASWINSYRDEEEMREIFLNMDRAMKYLHDRGYCIKSFDPRNIYILNNSIDQIKLDVLPLPSDYSESKKYVKEDIYNSSFVQIGLYSKCLPYLKREFLKSNFDKFCEFLPEGDVPYYRGVIDRGASVYFCEYAMEKANRDLAALEKELAGEGMGTPAPKAPMGDVNVNTRINDGIYKQLSGKRDAAFVSLLLFPTALLVLGVVLALISLIISFG